MFNDISGIVIPDLIMNIISYHGFVNDKKPTVILSYCSTFVEYFLSKGFLILENGSIALNNLPLFVKQIIDAEILHKNYFVMACYRAISSEANTLKIIIICSSFFTGFASAYYNDKGNVFR